MKKTTTPDSSILSNLPQMLVELISGHVQLLKTHSHVLTVQQNNVTPVKSRGFDATNTTLDTLVHEFKVREDRIDELVLEVKALSGTVDMLVQIGLEGVYGTPTHQPTVRTPRAGASKAASRKPIKIHGAVTKTPVPTAAALSRFTKATIFDPECIITLRKTKQLSQVKFAGWLNTTSGNISAWERGQHMVRPAHSKLARMLYRRMKDSGVPIKVLTEKEFNIRYR